MDLVVRNEFGRPLFDWLIKNNIVNTISRDELKRNSDQMILLTDISSASDQPFVVPLSSGFILSETGLTLTQDCEIIKESAAVPDYAIQAMMAMISRELFFGHFSVRDIITNQRSSSFSTLKTTASLIPRYSNYYHWMIDTVPKIRYLQEFEEETDEDITILLPSNPPSFVNETLDILGWPSPKVEFATESIYKIERLVVPSFPKRQVDDLEWTQENILTGASIDKSKKEARENIYVSRSNDIERRVVNEDEVMELLSNYGFTCYHLEDRSLKQNVYLFNKANIIVGPHGAGLTDILFTKNATLIELFGSKIKHHYENMAETLGLGYEAVHCDSKGADLQVDIDQLERHILSYVESSD